MLFVVGATVFVSDGAVFAMDGAVSLQNRQPAPPANRRPRYVFAAFR